MVRDTRSSVLASVSCAILVLLVGVGCSTPAKRVEERRELFDGYPPTVQESIRAGRVRPGMTEDGVWMALGDPDRKAVESSDDGEIVIWLYTRSRPGFGVSIGGGGGSFGGTRVGGGGSIGRHSDEEFEAVVHFKAGVVSFARQATD